MIDGAEAAGDPEQYVRDMLDRGERIMGFGHRIYRAYDPRATVLRRTAFELGAPKAEVAAALEEAALKVLREKSPDRQLETNVEYWAAVVLDFAGIPADLTPAMFGCARVAGWSAHILEQKRTGRLIRPGARYIGPPPRPVSDVTQ
jgi:citrate synthase